jgi:hypothetical protein
MRNLTLAVDAKVLLEARKIALEKNTSVNQLVREYLRRLVEKEGRRTQALARLKDAMAEGILTVGERNWTREDLHER